MLVPQHIAQRVSNIIYEADCSTRMLLTNGHIELSERAYFGSLVGIAGVNLYNIRRFTRGFTFRLNVRDTHTYDGVFVFRYGNQIKVGVCESKLLRFQEDDGTMIPLSDIWDWNNDDGHSHFFKQIQSYSNWSQDCAVWFMFMLDLDQDLYCPPLDERGSACLWLEELQSHINDTGFTNANLWTLQDVLDIEEPPLTNLEKVIYDILMCKKGKKIDIDENALTVSLKYGKGERDVYLPLPYNGRNIEERSIQARKIEEFMSQYKFSFYRYYNMSGPDFKR